MNINLDTIISLSLSVTYILICHNILNVFYEYYLFFVKLFRLKNLERRFVGITFFEEWNKDSFNEFIYDFYGDNFITKLMTCGYCQSFWISFAIVWLSGPFGPSTLITVFAVAGLSSLLFLVFQKGYDYVACPNRQGYEVSEE